MCMCRPRRPLGWLPPVMAKGPSHVKMHGVLGVGPRVHPARGRREIIIHYNNITRGTRVVVIFPTRECALRTRAQASGQRSLC